MSRQANESKAKGSSRSKKAQPRKKGPTYLDISPTAAQKQEAIDLEANTPHLISILQNVVEAGARLTIYWDERNQCVKFSASDAGIEYTQNTYITSRHAHWLRAAALFAALVVERYGEDPTEWHNARRDVSDHDW